MIIFAIIYLVLVALMWYYFHLAYSKGGIWEDDYNKSLVGAIFFTFSPIVNTVVAFIGWLSDYPIKENGNKQEEILYKIFRIKK